MSGRSRLRSSGRLGRSSSEPLQATITSIRPVAASEASGLSVRAITWDSLCAGTIMKPSGKSAGPVSVVGPGTLPSILKEQSPKYTPVVSFPAPQ